MAAVGIGPIAFSRGGRPRPISVEGYREAARRALPEMVWTYVDGGADDLLTLRENRSAFDRWRLRQCVLAGTSERTLGVASKGLDLSFPVAIAPTGNNGLLHWSGDLAMARAAESAGTRLILSSASSYSIEEVAAATHENHWFQLYPWGDRDLAGSLIDRAATEGYAGIVVTVDVPVVGNREGERLKGMGVPPTLTPRRTLDAALRPRWMYGFLRHQRVSLRNLTGSTGVRAGTDSAAELHRQIGTPILGWEDLEWIRERWAGPLCVKGILDPQDASRAVAIGADGIIVSNHGGRQLNNALASIEALPPIADAVGGRATIVIDSGIRRGTDIVKALCLGADLCLVGRPALYGLAAEGERGVANVLAILREELERALRLMGCERVQDLDRSWLLDTRAQAATNV